ncbi:MAG: response regulator [Nitrospiraceae bacterium]|nr:response regulator [Nitrospiraceae bacterium]
MADKRKDPRVIFKKQVVVNNLLGATGLDLSKSGIYIHTGRHFIKGSVVNVSLPLGSTTLELKARVQHSKPGVGMGLEFLNITGEQKQLLFDFIKMHKDDAVPEKSDERQKVLIVDLNEATRRVYRSNLVLEGFTVFEAGSNSSARDIIEREKIDAVVYMSGADEAELFSVIRQKPELKGMPILVVSAKSTPGAPEAAVKAGATEFMVKMFTSPAKLAERIKSRLK